MLFLWVCVLERDRKYFYVVKLVIRGMKKNRVREEVRKGCGLGWDGYFYIG